MKLKYKVLLVHNPLSSQPLTWLSAGIRVATNSHWNHLAIEVDLFGEEYIFEANGKGVIRTKKQVWLTSHNREVLELTPKNNRRINFHELFDKLGSKYGFLDLLYLVKYLYKRRVEGSSYTWDGKVPKKYEGYFCSELFAILAGIENPHLVLPCDVERLPIFNSTTTYFTSKK
jgi:hypothetical protein